MESGLTESSETKSKTENLAVTEEADVDESIQMHIKKEQKHKYIRKQLTLILKRSTHLKKEAK